MTKPLSQKALKKEEELKPYWDLFISEHRHTKYISNDALAAKSVDLHDMTRLEALNIIKNILGNDSDLKRLQNSFKVFKNRKSKNIKPVELKSPNIDKLDSLKNRFGFSSYDEVLDYLFTPDEWLTEELITQSMFQQKEERALSLEGSVKSISKRLLPQTKLTLARAMDEMYISGAKLKTTSHKKVLSSLEAHPIKQALK